MRSDCDGNLLLRENDALGRHLASLPAFADLPAELMEQLHAHAEMVSFAPAEAVLREGQVNSSLYILIEGRLGVYVSGEKIAEIKHGGDLVGEMSVIATTPCSASVLAETPAQLLSIRVTEVSESLNIALHKLYSAILVDRLIATNAKARQFEAANRQLEAAENELRRINSELEIKVAERTLDLQARTDELEAQNAALLAGSRKIDDLFRSRTVAMERLTTVAATVLRPVKITLQGLTELPGAAAAVSESLSHLERFEAVMAPLSAAYFAERAVGSSRVLLVEGGAKELAVARMALGGTGVHLDIAPDRDAGLRMLAERAYDIVCTSLEFIDLTRVAHECRQTTKTVLVTSAPGAEVVAKIGQYPHLSNIVARSDTDRTFTVKNILTTVTKLITGDIFGAEKFLSWGVEVSSRTITTSIGRQESVEEVRRYFGDLGVSSHLLSRIALVTEELMTNAIFDAPLDGDGAPKYNFRPRNLGVILEPHEYATLRFATDGILAAVSVEDPFGALARSTIIEYLDRCYKGNFKAPDERKSGGGIGTFQMMEAADLVVYNIRPKRRTEVIALFALGSESRTRTGKSFHFFELQDP